MQNSSSGLWVQATRDTVASYRNVIEATVAQLTDSELRHRPAPEMNSVAVILRHLGGNLYSRWTDFMTSDGEKPDRNRDQEFEDWSGDRESLMAYFDRGFQALTDALADLSDDDANKIIYIRGEAHTVAQAVTRSVTHLSYHVGQIALTGRWVHRGSWQWSSIAPGTSAQHNAETWGTAASRAVMGSSDERPLPDGKRSSKK